MLDTTSKSATTFSNDEAKDRQRERPDLLGKFRQADGSWGEPIAGKQVGSVAARSWKEIDEPTGSDTPGGRSQRTERHDNEGHENE